MKDDYYVVGNGWLAVALLLPEGFKQIVALLLAVITFGIGIGVSMFERRDWRDLE